MTNRRSDDKRPRPPAAGGGGAARDRPPSLPRRPPGYEARELAVACLGEILQRGRALDEAFDRAVDAVGSIEARDRALARLIVMTVLRRKGELEAVVGSFLEKPLPADSGRLWPILLSAAAQLLVLATPPHAAISLAVDQCRADRKAHRFDRLANAVLRRVATSGAEILPRLDPVSLNVPDWLLARWTAAYGEAPAREIAAASLHEPPLDLSLKSGLDGDEAGAWAGRLGGELLPGGTVRLSGGGRIEDLAGFAEGAWWVQDAAAALPAKLLGSVAGQEVADLCAAPGGKTAQLASAGAAVTAVDQSGHRIARLVQNLARLQLHAEIVEADVVTWAPERTFDAVLLDAPCSATGTVRRHPDILHLKRKDDISERLVVQKTLLDRAAALVRPGGLLVYCTCSLEPEEGPGQIARFLGERSEFARVAIVAGEAGIEPEWLTPDGDLRTLPCHLPRTTPELSGLDGFYAVRLRRAG